MSGSDVIGLIAGQGVFPIAVAQGARKSGIALHCVAIRDLTRPEIEAEVDSVTWIHLGEAAKGIGSFAAAGVDRVVMAGKVPKELLYRENVSLELDESAKDVMGALGDRRDDTILGAVADFLAKVGIELLPQYALAPDLLAGAGPLGTLAPTSEQEADVRFGFPIAKRIAALDIGQTLVVKNRAVIAVEAIEGTDAAIRRAGEITPDTCVLKVEKPSQDARFDVPTIGPDTIDSLAAARASLLAFEAGVTVVLERERLVREADARGICVLGVDPNALDSDAA